MIAIHPINLMPYFWAETTSKILENHLPYANIHLTRRTLFYKPQQPNRNAIMRSQLPKIYSTLRQLSFTSFPITVMHPSGSHKGMRHLPLKKPWKLPLNRKLPNNLKPQKFILLLTLLMTNITKYWNYFSNPYQWKVHETQKTSKAT